MIYSFHSRFWKRLTVTKKDKILLDQMRRHFIRILDELRSEGLLEKGVRLGTGLGILKVVVLALKT